MADQTQEPGHKLTWLAVILTIVLQFPGLVIGFVIAFVYRYILEFFLAGSILDWISQGWFNKILLTYFPAFLSGGIGGGLAILVASLILKRANYEIVMYAVSSVVIAFTAVALVGNLAQFGVSLTILEIGANTFGIVVGLYAVATHIKEERLDG